MIQWREPVTEVAEWLNFLSPAHEVGRGYCQQHVRVSFRTFDLIFLSPAHEVERGYCQQHVHVSFPDDISPTVSRIVLLFCAFWGLGPLI